MISYQNNSVFIRIILRIISYQNYSVIDLCFITTCHLFTTECPHTKFDVAFLLDSSGSINQARKENYQILKDFIKGIVKSFTIGENKTTVALATFSSLHRFKVRFNFTTYSAAPQIIAAIENVPYVGGQTYTADALTRLRTELFPLARPGVPHILIVLTDGRAHDNVTLPAQHLRDLGVHIISVGVGYVDYKELGEIATDPDNENVFTASFDSVVSLTGSILEDVCKGEQYLGEKATNETKLAENKKKVQDN